MELRISCMLMGGGGAAALLPPPPAWGLLAAPPATLPIRLANTGGSLVVSGDGEGAAPSEPSG